MPWPPSKDHRDYQTRGRWEGRTPPSWLLPFGRNPRIPYRYALAAGAGGWLVGGVFGAIVGWNPLPTALVGGLVGQTGLDLRWWLRVRRRTASDEPV